MSYNVLARDKITIAAAADLRFAPGEVVAAFAQANPADEVETIYGSSGKFHTQIRQGAPFDLFFSLRSPTRACWKKRVWPPPSVVG